MTQYINLIPRQSLFTNIIFFRMAYPNKYEIYRRVDEPNGKEKYVLIAELEEKPTPDDITAAFKGPKK
jgi:adenylate kinase